MNGLSIVLRHVSRCYGSGDQAVAAVHDVSFEVTEGEFVCVVGPSGSGKSTLLNLVAGLDAPDHGQVMVAGAELAQLDDDARSDLRLRALGFVFQAFHLFPTFTVEENVAWPLEFQGVRWADARLRAADILEQVGIPRAARARRPAELSGGEQQRVALARALVAEPEVLLADEPTGNLDTRTGATILDLVRDLNTTRRLTVLMVTHSAHAAAYANRIIEMRDGRVVQC
jgi:ABC-type lipoprotein export system ATPase subunit